IRAAIEKAGYEFVHIPAHRVCDDFPVTLEAMQEYAAVIISDVGKNTFLLHPDTFFQSKATVNKLSLIRDYVEAGGGFVMVGGYMTFMGIDGRAGYKGTVIESILPVTLMSGDDRVEIPEGVVPYVPEGETFWSGMGEKWPSLLGYNRLEAKPDGRVLLRTDADPVIVAGTCGKGKTIAFATDCAPHWAPPQFCEWEHYPTMWAKMLAWLEE
ncbi:MAG: glutamine amidotransferase, partial [Planctomycetes bacterium]|nr:glutamine amidotransferase [Planctomycetota bacterium]